jgi:uncharacterized protein (UPF0548 family)
VIRLRRPSRDEIRAELRVAGRPFSYAEVAATADPARFAALAANYDLDRHCFPLGDGRDLFERARASLLSWDHFEIAWLELLGAGTPPCAGQTVATLTRAAGLWFLNACRVVYVEGDGGSSNEVAFAYGTLPGHVEQGEERFAVCFDPATGAVTYRITAFSRPAVLATKVAKPWVRRIQRRFAASSAEALARACCSAAGLPAPTHGGRP